MRTPTRRQLRVYSIVGESIDERGFPPTLREISAALGVTSTNGTTYHLDALARKGLLTVAGGVQRGVRPVPGAVPIFTAAGCVGVTRGWRVIARVPAAVPPPNGSLSIACPVCGSTPGVRCTDASGADRLSHRARVNAAATVKPSSTP